MERIKTIIILAIVICMSICCLTACGETTNYDGTYYYYWDNGTADETNYFTIEGKSCKCGLFPAAELEIDIKGNEFTLYNVVSGKKVEFSKGTIEEGQVTLTTFNVTYFLNGYQPISSNTQDNQTNNNDNGEVDNSNSSNENDTDPNANNDSNTSNEDVAHTHISDNTYRHNSTYHWQVCNICSEVLNKNIHQYGEWIITKEATEREKGSRKHICTICGYEETEVINKIEIQEYLIHFDLNGGSSSSYVNSKSVRDLDSNDFFFNVTKDGYSFRGWSYNNTKVFDENGRLVNNVTITNGMTFKAIFTQTTILTISSNMQAAATIYGAGEYDYNTNVDMSVNVNRGYEFIGWYYNGTLLSNQTNYNYMMWDTDIELEARFDYAKYDLDIYAYNSDYGLVLYKATGLNDYSEEYHTQFKYLSNVVISAYTKTDVRFLGWFDENNNLVSTNAVYSFTMPYNDYELYAKWNYFTISYNLNEGTNNINNPYEYTNEDSNIQLYNPSKTGYTFNGWVYNDKVVANINTSESKDITLNAIWSPTEYTITYNLNNGTNNVNNPSKYTIEQAVHLEEASRNGYDFKGWYKESTFSTKITSIPIGYYGNQQVYAKWEIIEYTITYNLNGGENNDSNPYTYTIEDTDIVLLSPKIRIGYNFKGWFLEDTFDNTIEEIPQQSYGNKQIYAQWDRINGFNYLYTISNNTLTITGLIDKTIETIHVANNYNGFEVVSISEGAFSGCNNLKIVTLPFVGESKDMSAPDLGTRSKLFGYVFGKNNYSNAILTRQYYQPTNYETYYIPSTLKEVTIQDGTFSYGAFMNCNSIERINMGENVRTYISCFEGCTELQEIVIPRRTTTISDAFRNCSNLKKVLFEQGSYLKTIDEFAFYYCTSLTTIEIPSNVTTIQNYAFKGCTSLENIEIPSNVTRIYGSAFYGCNSLINVNFQDNSKLLEIGTGVFCDCSSLSSIVLPNSIINIGVDAFKNCYNLTSIVLPESISSIQGATFYNCRQLISIVIPYKVTYIEVGAFNSCESLTQITLPKSLTSIGNNAFDHCNNLTKIYYYGTQPYSDSIEIAERNDSITDTQYSIWYYYTENGENELNIGNWWYYDNQGNIVEIIN